MRVSGAMEDIRLHSAVVGVKCLRNQENDVVVGAVGSDPNARANSPRRCGHLDGWKSARRLGGRGTRECNRRKYKAERRGSVPFSHAHFVPLIAVVVGEVQQEKRGQHRRPWKRPC